MKKYLAPIVAALIGFMFLGPLGSLVAVVIWAACTGKFSKA